jgi:hypothetical protein
MFISEQIGNALEMNYEFQAAEDEATEHWSLLDALFRDCIHMYLTQ